MQFLGGGRTSPSGETQLPGHANYFVGRDPSGWRTSIPTFGRVRYPRAFEGIDVVNPMRG